MREFEITYEDAQDGVTLIHVLGWLDAHTFELMDQAVNSQFEAGNVKLIINLENVEYISSAGAGVFIGALTSAKERDGEIVLMNPVQAVKEVFDLLGLSQIFKFATSIEEGVQLANSP